MIFIYIITNISININEIYIGKTNNIIFRTNNHKRRFGEQINVNIIDQINSNKREDWGPLESFWIEQFRQWGFKLHNKNKGGGGPEFVSDKTINKITQSNKKHYEKGSERNKKISMSLIGIKNPNRNGGLKNKGKKFTSEHKQKITNGKMGSKYPPKTEEQKLHYKYSHSYLNKIIIQYNMEGDFIKEWPSMKEAGDKLNINSGSISSCCLGNQKTYKNYIWKLK